MSDKYVLKNLSRYIRLNDEELSFTGDLPSLVFKIAAIAVEANDQVIFDEIIRVAKEAGVTDLYLIDKRFVIEALEEKMQREREKNG